MNLNDISYALKGDFHAIRFFQHMRQALHFWDDLHDADKPITRQEIHGAMWACLVELPSNPFYQKHFQALQATLHNAIANWMAANEFEQSDDDKNLATAYVIRSDYANLLIQCAYLVGGKEWMFEIAPKIRQAWTVESFTKYKQNLGIEKASRNKAAMLKQWYEEETDEYLKHGLLCFNAALLGADDKQHAAKLYEMAGIPKGAVIVDMGAGVGGLPMLMQTIDETIVAYGVTNVQRQADLMREWGKVQPVLCDFHDVPLKPESADVVIFNETIGYGDLRLLLKEAWRLLKKGGFVVIKDGEAPEPMFSPFWQYATTPFGTIDSAAKSLGFEIEKSDVIEYNDDRFRAFLQSSKLMNDRYGAYDTPPQVVGKFWKFRKA